MSKFSISAVFRIFIFIIMTLAASYYGGLLLEIFTWGLQSRQRYAIGIGMLLFEVFFITCCAFDFKDSNTSTGVLIQFSLRSYMALIVTFSIILGLNLYPLPHSRTQIGMGSCDLEYGFPFVFRIEFEREGISQWMYFFLLLNVITSLGFIYALYIFIGFIRKRNAITLIFLFPLIRLAGVTW